MCFDTNKKAALEVRLDIIKDQIANHYKGEAVMEHADLMTAIYNQRDVEREIGALPHKFSVGDGAHTSNNGDSYPYKVVNVSPSGKTIQVARMDYKAAAPDLPYGHDDWVVIDNVDTTVTTTGDVYTLRKNGRWIAKGCTQDAYYMALHPGAYFSRNPHV